MLSWGRQSRDAEREPLLPRHNQDTDLQASASRKLHTYQKLRAVSQGYMPSNDQLVSGIHQILASDVFQDSTAQDLSPSGRSLLATLERSLKHVAEFLERKNESDQIQDFIWYLSKSRLSVDTKDLGRRATKAKAKADLTGGKLT